MLITMMMMMRRRRRRMNELNKKTVTWKNNTSVGNITCLTTKICQQHFKWAFDMEPLPKLNAVWQSIRDRFHRIFSATTEDKFELVLTATENRCNAYLNWCYASRDITPHSEAFDTWQLDECNSHVRHVSIIQWSRSTQASNNRKPFIKASTIKLIAHWCNGNVFFTKACLKFADSVSLLSK